ncbi:PrsW family intramembrane metalloprotease [Patescibacteria group bacterium]|nr:PrsW family intramembrane metalloprotease [Patescibacteria group bacterium]
MTYLLFFIFGLAPSIIWLLFFLRKDVHPEPKGMVLKIFFYGVLITLPAIFIERGIFERFTELKLSPILYIFFGIALVEEILKYLVVREKVVSDPEFDEPLDAMLYMIISALGFAALENLLFFFSPEIFLLPFKEILVLVSFRFITATFLHALCSGLVGYFLAQSFFEIKNRFRLITTGLGIAIILHGLYNFSIMMMEGALRFLIPVIILISLAFVISLGFKKLEKMKSICKIKYNGYFF